jgi:hypothetical protein
MEPLQPNRPRDATPEAVFREAAGRFLDVQFRINETLDARNAGTFSIGSAVLPVTVGLLGLAEREIPTRANYTLIAALVCYLLLGACFWWASLTRQLEYRPHLPTLERYSGEYTLIALEEWVGREYVDSAQTNEPQLERKSRWVGAATTLLFIEAVLLALAAFWTLL